MTTLMAIARPSRGTQVARASPMLVMAAPYESISPTTRQGATMRSKRFSGVRPIVETPAANREGKGGAMQATITDASPGKTASQRTTR